MCNITEYHLEQQATCEKMTRGIRGRAQQIVPNPEDTWKHCIVDELLADGYTNFSDVPDIDGLIRCNTMRVPARVPRNPASARTDEEDHDDA